MEVTRSLENWRKNGWLKPHTSSPAEIADLLALAERDLKDLQGKTGSDWDKAWADKMVGDHKDAINLFEKYSKEVKDNSLKTIFKTQFT